MNHVQMEYVWEEEVNFKNINYIHFQILFTMVLYAVYLVCRGVDGALLPAAVQTFSGCTIVNGDLTFNLVTYEQFM